ncbi:unnamed protein product [Meloidogyne enterolobii]|uniref:Uncharacterized protein n=2 Tax=Meloidogyne enterolobii TaxID=390850 RepID=A0ACB1AKC5_MELEN|nr:unnamed protein product [Meloidogyne enterolobii]
MASTIVVLFSIIYLLLSIAGTMLYCCCKKKERKELTMETYAGLSVDDENKIEISKKKK